MALTSQLLENNTTERLLELSKKHLTLSLFLFVKRHFSLKNKYKQGFRYSDELKQLALTVYFLGPRVYTFLMKTLSLPNPYIFRRVTQRFQ